MGTAFSRQFKGIMSSNKAFTLIEALIVVAIVSVLASISIPP